VKINSVFTYMVFLSEVLLTLQTGALGTAKRGLTFDP